MPEELVYGSLITDTGTKKLVEAAKNGKKIDLVRFQVGDGDGEYYLPTKEQTELKNKVYESDLTSYEISPYDDKLILVRCQIPSEVGPFTIREWGLVDSEGDLIAVSNVSDISVVPYDTGEIIHLKIEIYIQFDNLEIGGVNIVVKPTTEELLRQDILEHVDVLLNDFEAIPDPRIDEIVGSIVGTVPVAVCSPIPEDVLVRILDDDESNDPEYTDEEGSIEGPVLGSIFDTYDD